jgi:hypothetical protein
MRIGCPFSGLDFFTQVRFGFEDHGCPGQGPASIRHTRSELREPNAAFEQTGEALRYFVAIDAAAAVPIVKRKHAANSRTRRQFLLVESRVAVFIIELNRPVRGCLWINMRSGNPRRTARATGNRQQQAEPEQ